MALVCSLAFLGRITEAENIYRLAEGELDSQMKARSRFSLALACTRISKFKRARFWLRGSLNEPGLRDQPDTHQGLAVYHYYLGKFDQASIHAQKALRLAMKNNDKYIRAFATDLSGHALVQTGRRAAGLKRLEEARVLSGRNDPANPFSAAQLVYEAEAGLRAKSIIDDLRARVSPSQEDSFTRANFALELARQLTLRGKFQEARDLLDRESHNIYGFENRRHEATLQLRLAEIAYRQGELSSAQHFLQAARRCLNKIADNIYELRIIGLERKIEELTTGSLPPPSERLLALSHSHANPINTRILGRQGLRLKTEQRSDDDPLGDLIDRVNRDPKKHGRELLKLGYLGLWPAAQGFAPGENHIIVFDSAEWVACSKQQVSYSATPLSALSLKILSQLSKGASKEKLIETVWNYNYDPLRHDSLVYAAIAALRRHLGHFGEWIVTQEDGWMLDRTVSFHSPMRERNVATAPLDREILALTPTLNLRQNRALSELNVRPSWTVPDYKSFFNVSTMTAWRDLDELVDKRYLIRLGRARSTAYVKANSPS